MGMAASQARLLSLTARMHDVEFKAQSIQNAKIALSTQSDQVYADYQAALDATTLTLTAIDPQSGNKSTVAATFNNLFAKNKLVSATGKDYALRDKHGRLVVPQDEFDAYYAFKNSGKAQNANMFAMFMLDLHPNDTTVQDKREVALIAEDWAYSEFTGSQNNGYQSDVADKLTKLHNDILGLLGNTGSNASDALYDTSNLDSKNKAVYEQKLNRYLSILYSTKSDDGGPSRAELISNQINGVATNNGSNTSISYNIDDFNYYVNKFNQIEACGGCVSIEEFNGFDGDAKNDSDWLKSMVESGLMSIETVKYDNEGKVVLNGTSPSSDDNVSYTATSSIDPTALKKAEAKYEHDMKQINQKDKMFDLDLTRLDTERNALKTEYDQVKKVASENIERTFGIFS